MGLPRSVKFWMPALLLLSGCVAVAPPPQAERVVPAVPRSILSVSSFPAFASVTVDGKDFGKTPLEALKLDPGRHAVVVSLEGYDRYEVTLNLQQGETKILGVNLAKPGEKAGNDTAPNVEPVAKQEPPDGAPKPAEVTPAEVQPPQTRSAVAVKLPAEVNLSALHARVASHVYESLYKIAEQDASPPSVLMDVTCDVSSLSPDLLTVKFAQTTNDTAFIGRTGSVLIVSDTGLPDLAGKDILDTELAKVLQLVRCTGTALADDALREARFRAPEYYGAQEGVYHRIAMASDTARTWTLTVPACEIKEARVWASGKDAEHLLSLEGREPKPLGGNYSDATDLLSTVAVQLSFQPSGRREALLEIMTAPCAETFTISGDKSGEVTAGRNKPFDAVSIPVPGPAGKPTETPARSTVALPGGLRSAVTTRIFVPKLLLDSIESVARTQGYEMASSGKKLLVIKLPQAANDYAYVTAGGDILVISQEPLSDLSQKDILEAELWKVLDLIKAATPEVPAGAIHVARYQNAWYYSDGRDTYHQIIMCGNREHRWSLRVPKCEIHRARARRLLPTPSSILIEDASLKEDSGGYFDPKGLLRTGTRTMKFTVQGWGGWAESMLEIMASATEKGFAVSGMGAENVFIKRNRDIRDLHLYLE